MTGYVLVYRARDGWRWHKVAGNGFVTSESGEAYRTRWGAKRAARREHPSFEIRVEAVR